MLIARDLSGREVAMPTPMELRWQGGLTFDGRTIVLERNVLVTGANDQLQCDELAARLSSNVEFGRRVDQNAIELAEVECRGRVVMDHKSRDAVGVTSHERMEIDRLSLNQQSGVISGTGPGVIRSTHFAGQLSALTNPRVADGGYSPNADDAKLRFLQVDFQGELGGNLYTREIRFKTQVRTVYGPVDAWEQELDIDRPELLPLDTLTLTSDELGINEDPLTANRRPRDLAQVSGSPFGPIQLVAQGNVKIDGQSPTQGEFAAAADRVSYEQAKELFILRGTDRVPATLRHRDPTSGQQVDDAAREIKYNRMTGDFEQDGGRGMQLIPGAGGSIRWGNAIAPAAQRQ
jgi:hypothetical protein